MLGIQFYWNGPEFQWHFQILLGGSYDLSQPWTITVINWFLHWLNCSIWLDAVLKELFFQNIFFIVSLLIAFFIYFTI